MTGDAQALQAVLHRLDGRGYKAYRDVEGSWSFPGFTLAIDHVQGDPFAAPSRLRALIPAVTATFDPATYAHPSRAVGLACYLARAFAAAAHRQARHRGSGRSGAIAIESPGQRVYPQTAVIVSPAGDIEARFTVGLPAAGRRVLGREAAELLAEDVPAVVAASLVAGAHDPALAWRHAAANEDADALRAQLDERGLVAFVADGAILPRRSGVDDRPLQDGAVAFESPPSLRVTIPAPHAGDVTGLGVPRGVTLIVGGGYHGKSTLLSAMQEGVYNHRPADGREQVVTVADAVKIRAEDGRSVAGVDISPFIGDLPGGQDTRAFTSSNASGSTSQAAAIMEALEAGATALLVDEDTSATNFMIRDRRMQALVAKEFEPITPFVDRVRQLYEGCGVSSVLVVGGSGDYLDVADTVLALHGYRPLDVTTEARAVAAAHPTGRVAEAGGPFACRPARIPDPASIDPRRGRRDVSVKARGRSTLLFGEETIDLTAVEQLVAWPQTRAIGAALLVARERHMDGRRTLAEVLEAVMADVAREGLDVLDRRLVGDLAHFRRLELAAALNRLRSLRVRRVG